MPSRVAGLTRGTVATAPAVCRDCVWWQSRGNRTASKERWIERVEEESGEWGTIYYDDDGSVLGSMQYGASGLFPRADDLPAGPPSDDAVLVTCAYLTREGLDWVLSPSSSPPSGRRATRVPARSRRSRTAIRSASLRERASSCTERCSPRLPRGVRVQHAARPGARGAMPARARRPRAGRGGTARPRPAGRAGGLHASAGRLSAVAVSGASCGVSQRQTGKSIVVRRRTTAINMEWGVPQRSFRTVARGTLRARPQRCKLARNTRLERAWWRRSFEQEWSPQQIAGWLKLEYPQDETMRASHETIYLTLLVQARGASKRELRRAPTPHALDPPAACRRDAATAARVRSLTPSRSGNGPPEAEDRAIPGHWEGDCSPAPPTATSRRSSSGTRAL